MLPSDVTLASVESAPVHGGQIERRRSAGDIVAESQQLELQ
jgi:hypothetical protein